MDIKTRFSDARTKLAALPHWIKVLMWAQVIVSCFSLACLAMTLVIQQEHIIAFWNAYVTLMQQLPESEGNRVALRRAVELGVNEKYWLIGLVATIMASAFISCVVVGMMPW